MDEPRLDAAERGDKKYDGRPCVRCGATERYTISGNCVDCVKTRTTASQKKYRDLIKKAREKASK